MEKPNGNVTEKLKLIYLQNFVFILAFSSTLLFGFKLLTDIPEQKNYHFIRLLVNVIVESIVWVLYSGDIRADIDSIINDKDHKD